MDRPGSGIDELREAIQNGHECPTGIVEQIVAVRQELVNKIQDLLNFLHPAQETVVTCSEALVSPRPERVPLIGCT